MGNDHADRPDGHAGGMSPRPRKGWGRLRPYPVVSQSRRRLLQTGLWLSLTMSLGCSPPQRKIRVAGNNWVGYAPLFLARDLGHYRSSQLAVLDSASNSASLLALAAGAIEAAALTLDECISARAAGLDLRVILLYDESAGGDVIMARPSIRSLDELRGRRVGLENTATGALLLTQVLDSAGLGPEEIEKVSLSPADQVRAYLTGEVDAVVCFEPQAILLARAGAHRLVDSRQFPGLIINVLAVRQDAIETGAAALSALVAGHFRALDYLERSRTEAVGRIARQLGIHPEEVLAALGGIRLFDLHENHAWLGGPNPRLHGVANRLNQLMLDARLIAQAADTRHLAEDRFLPSRSA